MGNDIVWKQTKQAIYLIANRYMLYFLKTQSGVRIKSMISKIKESVIVNKHVHVKKIFLNK